MSHCEQHGKDKIIFLTPDDAKPETAKVSLPPDTEEDQPPGLVLADGSINWNCPCLGGMPAGPCGVQFRTAFECFHYSSEEVKGQECLEKFAEFNECMKKHPELYAEKEEVPSGSLEAEESRLPEENRTQDEADKK